MTSIEKWKAIFDKYNIEYYLEGEGETEMVFINDPKYLMDMYKGGGILGDELKKLCDDTKDIVCSLGFEPVDGKNIITHTSFYYKNNPNKNYATAANV